MNQHQIRKRKVESYYKQHPISFEMEAFIREQARLEMNRLHNPKKIDPKQLRKNKKDME